MSRNRVSASISSIGAFVNFMTVAASVALIGVAYFSAIGQIAGIA